MPVVCATPYTGIHFLLVNHFNFVSTFSCFVFGNKKQPTAKEDANDLKEWKRKRNDSIVNKKENGTVPCTRRVHIFSHCNEDKCYDWSRNVILEISNKTILITVFVEIWINENKNEHSILIMSNARFCCCRRRRRWSWVVFVIDRKVISHRIQLTNFHSPIWTVRLLYWTTQMKIGKQENHVNFRRGKEKKTKSRFWLSRLAISYRLEESTVPIDYLHFLFMEWIDFGFGIKCSAQMTCLFGRGRSFLELFIVFLTLPGCYSFLRNVKTEKLETKAKIWENRLPHKRNGDLDDTQILHKMNGI